MSQAKTTAETSAAVTEDKLNEAAPATAKAGWVSRAAGFVKQVLAPVHEQVAPLPPPPDVPPSLMDDEVQLEGDGFGALLGRRYALTLRSDLAPETLMDRIKRNVAQLSPDEFAAFEKTNGVPWALKLGDEFDIQILGPWNGRVRVIDLQPDSFSFVTLRGHPEAGRIRFSVEPAPEGRLTAAITSWARSRDAVVDLGYDKLGLGKGVQTTTWRTFLERVAALSDAEMIGEVVVSEQKLEDDLTPKREAADGP